MAAATPAPREVIKTWLENYLSQDNIQANEELRKRLRASGVVEFSTILSWPRINQLVAEILGEAAAVTATQDTKVKVIEDILATSEAIEVATVGNASGIRNKTIKSTQTPQLSQQPPQQLKSNALVAAGVFVTCTDPDTHEAWLLLGVNTQGHLCHFHGFNDSRKGPESTVLPYSEAVRMTIGHEFAEESLEAAGSQYQVEEAIARGGEWSRLGLFGHSSDAGGCCGWVHIGMKGPISRAAILRTFLHNLRIPWLKSCQKENARLCWVKGTELARAATSPEEGRLRCLCSVWDTQHHVMVDHEMRGWRAWVTPHLIMLFSQNVAIGSVAKEFQDFCLSTIPCPLRSIHDL